MPTASLPGLTPQKLFNLFYKFPLEHIPLVRDQSIKAYISKERTTRQANTVDFFNRDLIQSLSEIMERLPEDDFFTEVDNLGDQLQEIPMIDSQQFTVQFLPVSQFNSIYRPLEELEESLFRVVLEELELPVLVFNSRKDLIFKNKKSRKLQRSFQEVIGIKYGTLEEYLPSHFYDLLDQSERTKVYNLEAGEREIIYRYKVARQELAKGLVYVIIFLNSGDEGM